MICIIHLILLLPEMTSQRNGEIPEKVAMLQMEIGEGRILTSQGYLTLFEKLSFQNLHSFIILYFMNKDQYQKPNLPGSRILELNQGSKL
jgi:hypothetical protein